MKRFWSRVWWWIQYGWTRPDNGSYDDKWNGR